MLHASGAPLLCVPSLSLSKSLTNSLPRKQHKSAVGADQFQWDLKTRLFAWCS